MAIVKRLKIRPSSSDFCPLAFVFNSSLIPRLLAPLDAADRGFAGRQQQEARRTNRKLDAKSSWPTRNLY